MFKSLSDIPTDTKLAQILLYTFLRYRISHRGSSWFSTAVGCFLQPELHFLPGILTVSGGFKLKTRDRGSRWLSVLCCDIIWRSKGMKPMTELSARVGLWTDGVSITMVTERHPRLPPAVRI